MECVEDTVQGSRLVKAVRIASLVVAAFLAASVALALAGCAVPYVERPSAEVILVPVA